MVSLVMSGPLGTNWTVASPSALDAGPVILQSAVPVRPGDTAERLAARVLREEHRIYPLALRWLLDGLLERDSERVTVRGGVPQCLFPLPRTGGR